MKILMLVLIALSLSADLKSVNLVKGIPQSIGTAGDVIAVQVATTTNTYITHGGCAYDASRAMLLPSRKIVSLGSLTDEVCAFTTAEKAILKVQKD